MKNLGEELISKKIHDFKNTQKPVFEKNKCNSIFGVIKKYLHQMKHINLCPNIRAEIYWNNKR